MPYAVAPRLPFSPGVTTGAGPLLNATKGRKPFSVTLKAVTPVGVKEIVEKSWTVMSLVENGRAVDSVGAEPLGFHVTVTGAAQAVVAHAPVTARPAAIDSKCLRSVFMLIIPLVRHRLARLAATPYTTLR